MTLLKPLLTAIAGTALFFSAGSPVFAQTKTFHSFDEAVPELQRLLECHDWEKISNLNSPDIDVLPVAKIHPRKIPGIRVDSHEGNDGAAITYQFPRSIKLFGFNVNKMDIYYGESGRDAGEGDIVRQGFRIAGDKNKILNAVENKLGTKLPHSDEDGGNVLKRKKRIVELIDYKEEGEKDGLYFFCGVLW